MPPGIQVFSVLLEPEVEVRSGRATGRSNVTNNRALRDSLSHPNFYFRQMKIERLIASIMSDSNHFPRGTFSGREHDTSFGHGSNGGAGRSGVIDASVKMSFLQNRVFSISKRRADSSKTERRAKKSALRGLTV